MATAIKKQIDDVFTELETVADEIRVKVHLASMDAHDMWRNKLEPRLDEARQHAREAGEASRTALESTLKAFRDFQKTL